METLQNHENRLRHVTEPEVYPNTDSILEHARELLKELRTNEIPRQRDVLNILIGRATFELGCRSLE